MTVKELRRKLLDFPDDMEVQILDADDARYTWPIGDTIAKKETDCGEVVVLVAVPF